LPRLCRPVTPLSLRDLSARRQKPDGRDTHPTCNGISRGHSPYPHLPHRVGGTNRRGIE
jgi:hypothetical protein